jgi:CRP-like cAMP-binding protein
VIKEELYNTGDTIVKEKAHGKWLWVVYEGVVRIEKETPQGTITLTRLGEGSFIGTFKALLFGEYARSATVLAENDVRLCLLDAEMLHREYASLSYIFRTLLLSLDDRLRKTTEKAIGLRAFGGESAVLPRSIKTIIDKGSSIDDLYKIEEGEAYIVNKNGINIEPLFTLQKNDIFGFIPFLDIGHEPNTVAVVGNGNLRLQSLDPGHMQSEYERLTPTFRNLIHHIGTCIHTTTTRLFHDNMWIII